jgi:hypothetical protein
MTTLRQYAKSATAALHAGTRVSADDFDAEETAAVIEQAIRALSPNFGDGAAGQAAAVVG